MLVSLSVRDIVLIDAVDLELGPGLNVLTGETGAGKSILLDALGLALGRRGRADAARAGAGEGAVTAVFEIGADHPARAALAEAGLPAEGEELILRRVVSPDGRTRAFVNDRRCGVEALRSVGETLVEIHGQHDDRGLLSESGHRALLDAFGGLEARRAAVRAAWRRAGEAAARLAGAEAGAEAAARDRDYLVHAVDELEGFAPREGEDAELDARRRLLREGEKLSEELGRAAGALGAGGAEAALAEATKRVERAAASAEGLLDPTLTALERVLNELAEAQTALAGALDALDLDPAALEAVEERLFALRALARKHQVEPDALPALTQDFRARLDAVEGGEARIAALRAEAEAARAAYDAEAAALSAERADAAARLDAAVATELAPLKLDRAVFRTTVAEDQPGPDGRDRVAFEVATSPGAPMGPVARIASGGELSRFLLALKVALRSGREAATLIFDEIDRGVGGATADAVGRRLAKLAEGAQVLVVTHSPQVAARGSHHWRILKEVAGEATRTRVTPLAPAARTDEIARMLAGERITPEAKSAASALLAG